MHTNATFEVLHPYYKLAYISKKGGCLYVIVDILYMSQWLQANIFEYNWM